MKLASEKKAFAAPAFTLVEVLLALTLVTILTTLSGAVYLRAREGAKIAQSTANLRSLAAANMAYASDYGTFCPAQDRKNNVRWHGSRSGGGKAFDPTTGFLAPYLGRSRAVSECPLFRDFLEEGSFELGSGGYGYNSHYVGGTAGKLFEPEKLLNLPHASRTVMFTTTAFAKGTGLQEYPFSEPFKSIGRNGKLSGSLQPSTHFRANGNALVAWCDGNVTAEAPNRDSKSPNYYGGDNETAQVGWFGPEEQNGYWNPKAENDVFR